jgi:hypothetical protein
MSKIVSSPAMVPRIDSQPTRSIAPAKYWAAPGGVRSTTRLAEASADTKISAHSRARRPAKLANSPTWGFRSPPSAGTA